MVLARVAEYLFPPPGPSSHPAPTITTLNYNYTDDGRDAPPPPAPTAPARRPQKELRPDNMTTQQHQPAAVEDDTDYEAYRPPYLHAMLAGGIGGTMGDMLMHSLDTVKTRQQGDPHMPPRYTSMGNTYYTILRQEGVWRGLYGGVQPAFLGSFGGTLIFFGCYEWSKRYLLDAGLTPSLAYLTAGFFSDLAASPLYVPTEVLKTRLQLQGRFNNPFFTSGYNYRSSLHALRTIYRSEGLAELFSGYKATLFRDLPFSALQFTFYEQEQRLAKEWVGSGSDIGLPLEILTGASAGGMAGVLTCPMDVVKTRIQTELDPEVAAAARQVKREKKAAASLKLGSSNATGTTTTTATTSSTTAATTTTTTATAGDPHHHPTHHRPTPTSHPTTHPPSAQQKHPISTSSPSTTLKHHGQVALDTESVVKALRIIYRTEGLAGWFRGVGPRFVWTSVQSGTMLLAYQKLLKWFDGGGSGRVDEDDEGLRGVRG
ncbi:hypothetical protein LTR36_004160 [Oleoguttula mirabilis]|uniref:Mitochondrial carrier protein n=1 Tax=Oleoguttula mirabilis TaxID=1507867 RepID=A0AAV9JHI2_9PEZI|nr:hypothetical protein LTR36_004160 [Oleoguttula mirabilis]